MSKTQEKTSQTPNPKLIKLARRLGDAMASANNHRKGLFDDLQAIKTLAAELNADEKDALLLVVIRTFEEFQLTAELMGETANMLSAGTKESEVAIAMKTAQGVH